MTTLNNVQNNNIIEQWTEQLINILKCVSFWWRVVEQSQNSCCIKIVT